jgi:hypothetical protein
MHEDAYLESKLQQAINRDRTKNVKKTPLFYNIINYLKWAGKLPHTSQTSKSR